MRPCRLLVILALTLSLIGSLTAQVNAWVLRHTVDEITRLVNQHKTVDEGFSLLILITIILLAKEILNIIIQFGQKYYGEKPRIFISRDLAQTVIEKILTYQLAFYSVDGNQPGKLQTRIDRGVESLTRLVQNFLSTFCRSAPTLLWP